MNLNKLVEIFKDLEVSTKNIREFLKTMIILLTILDIKN